VSDAVVAVIGGLSLGGTFALIALGMVLVYRANETFNFAHGQFMLVPAFLVGRWQANNTMPSVLGIVLSLVIGIVLICGFYRLVLVRTVGLPVFMPVVATLGLAAILDGLSSIVFGSNEYTIRLDVLPDGVVSIFGTRVAWSTIVLTIFSFALAGVVAAVLRYTHLGTKVRAAGQDPLLASQSGINVGRVYMGSWGVAAGLAGVAGIAFGSTAVVNGNLTAVALLAFPVLVLGGMDSVLGAMLAAVLIGLLQGFATTYLSSHWVDYLTYGTLLAVLLVRPEGLLGTVRVSRA
jgi:branched-chain amino acid transport system permease protein